MQIKHTIAQLKLECEKRGIALLDGYKYQRKDYVELLRKDVSKHPEQWLNDHALTPGHDMSEGMEYMLRLESPMLCYTWGKLKQEEQESCMYGDRWMAQWKINGVRCIVTYFPDEGIRVFTRAIGTDYYPVELTKKLKVDGVPAQDWRDHIQDFVLDCELVLEGDVDLTEYIAEVDRVANMNVLVNPTSIVVHCDRDKVLACKGTFKLVVLDVLRWGGDVDVMVLPLWERMGILSKLMRNLEGDTFQLVADNVRYEMNKEEFYEKVIEQGGEGVVYKNIDMPYCASESRRRDYCVKRKPDTKGVEVDAYVSGVIRDKENRIVTLTLSVCDPYGDRVVGYINYFTEEERAKLFRTEGGVEELQEGIMGKVVRFTGSDFDPKQGVYRKITLDWNTDMRDDKTPMNCDGSELDDLF